MELEYYTLLCIASACATEAIEGYSSGYREAIDRTFPDEHLYYNNDPPQEYCNNIMTPEVTLHKKDILIQGIN